jgi:hypothetical protein
MRLVASRLVALVVLLLLLLQIHAAPSAATLAARARRQRCRACVAGAYDLLARDASLVLGAAAVAALPRAARRARELRVVALVSDEACSERALLDYTEASGGAGELAASVDSAGVAGPQIVDTRRMERLCREVAEDDESGFERAIVRGGDDADAIRRAACAVACEGVSEDDATKKFTLG